MGIQTDAAPYNVVTPPPGAGATGSLASGSGDPIVIPAGSEQQIRTYIISDKVAKCYKTDGGDDCHAWRAILAITIIDADTGEVLEDRAILIGADEKKSSGRLPGLSAKRPTRHTVTTMRYVLEYRKPKGSCIMGRYV